MEENECITFFVICIVSSFSIKRTTDSCMCPTPPWKWFSRNQWLTLFRIRCTFSWWFWIFFYYFFAKLSLSQGYSSANRKFLFLKKNERFWNLKILSPRMSIFLKITDFYKIIPRNTILNTNFDMDHKVVPLWYKPILSWFFIIFHNHSYLPLLSLSTKET